MQENQVDQILAPAQKIDKHIATLADWRGKLLTELRALILSTDPQITEDWKWRGTPVWYCDGMVCTGETYKEVVKMTFAKGAQLPDPQHLFNASMEGNARRAIDFHQGDPIHKKALQDLLRAAINLNHNKKQIQGQHK